MIVKPFVVMVILACFTIDVPMNNIETQHSVMIRRRSTSSKMFNIDQKTAASEKNWNVAGQARKGSPATIVKIHISRDLMDLLKKWDPEIWFFTSKQKPVSSLEGLKREDFACWGAEHFGRMEELFKLLGLEGVGIRVIGDGAYNETPNKPRLYITWAKYAPYLKGVARVQFVLKSQDSKAAK